MLTQGAGRDVDARAPIAGDPADAGDRPRITVVVDYALLLPVAPGIVLLKAPGPHARATRWFIVRLSRRARSYLLSADVTWALEGIVGRTQRPPATSERIREDRDALTLQIDWLAESIETSDLIVVPSHDSVYLAELVRRGVINEGLVED